MKRAFDMQSMRPLPVVRKEHYTLYCELLIALAELADGWADVNDVCAEFACGPGTLQRPLFFLATHGWIKVRTSDSGHIEKVLVTDRGWAHKALQK